MDANGFPQITSLKTVLGDPNPDWRGTLGLNARWKNFNMNVLFENRGYIHLIYDDFDLEHQIDVIKNQTAYGIKIKLIYPKEVKKLIPDINTKKLFAATYLPLGGTARHDALVWGLANACKNMGVDIFPFTEVKNILKLD